MNTLYVLNVTSRNRKASTPFFSLIHPPGYLSEFTHEVFYLALFCVSGHPTWGGGISPLITIEDIWYTASFRGFLLYLPLEHIPNISHPLFLFPDLLLRVPFASIQSLCLTVWLWPHLCPLFLIFSVCHSIWFIDCCWGALVQTPKEGMSGTGADSDALKLNYYSCHCLRLPLTAVCVIKPQKKYFLSTYWHIPLYRPTHLSVGNIGIEEKNSSPKSIFKSLQTYIFVLRH